MVLYGVYFTYLYIHVAAAAKSSKPQHCLALATFEVLLKEKNEGKKAVYEYNYT